MSYFRREPLYLSTFLSFVGAGLLLCATFGLFFWMGTRLVQNNLEWEAFAVRHKCKVVSVDAGSSTIATGVSTGGQVAIVPVFIPGKTGYLCDDGVTYYR